MNPAHYVSLEIAKLLEKLRILFPESEKVWVQWRLGFKEKSKWELIDRGEATYKTNRRTWEDRVLPAPSLDEIMDRLGPVYSTKINCFGKAICFNSDWIWNHKNNTDSDTRVNAAGQMLIKLEGE